MRTGTHLGEPRSRRASHAASCSLRYILGGRDATESDPAFWVAAYKGHTLQVTTTTVATTTRTVVITTRTTAAHAACLPGYIGRAGCAGLSWAALLSSSASCVYVRCRVTTRGPSSSRRSRLSLRARVPPSQRCATAVRDRLLRCPPPPPPRARLLRGVDPRDRPTRRPRHGPTQADHLLLLLWGHHEVAVMTTSRCLGDISRPHRWSAAPGTPRPTSNRSITHAPR